MKNTVEILERIDEKKLEIRGILLKGFEEGATIDQRRAAQSKVNGCDGYIAALERVLNGNG